MITQKRPVPMIVALVCCALVACEDQNKTAEPSPLRSVRTMTVAEPSSDLWREFPGVVDAGRKADLGFRVSGQLKALLVNEGDMVEQGQELARLDDSDYRIALDSSRAEFERAQADYQRGQSLVERSLMSRSDFNRLEAQFVAAKSSFESASNNVAYTVLKAPFSGQISKRWVENHEDVSTMQKVYSIVDLSSLAIKVGVPESVMIRLRSETYPRVSAYFDAIPDRSFPLSISAVATQADQDTHTFEVTLGMASVPDYNILPGMSVTVRGERESTAAATAMTFFVPAQAVLEDGDGRFVYVVNPGNDDTGTVARRDVATGELSSQGMSITEGLEIGDQVIIAGMSKMYPGLVVRWSKESDG